MRLIDADELNDVLIQKQYSAQSMGILYTEYPNMMGIVAKQPTIDAAPVVHGEWSTIEDDYVGLIALQCSECNQEYWFEDDPPLKIYNYCPNCGAKMGGEPNG